MLALRIPLELHQRLKVVAAKGHKSLTEITVGLLEAYVKDKEKQ